MKSRYYHLKEAAVAKRRQGISMTVIERDLGIPRSTLSGWFRSIHLTNEQKLKLTTNSSDGWAKARAQAVIAHRKQKTLRLLDAKIKATKTLAQIDCHNPAILDLAFAMLYFGEGTKKDRTSLASSDPKILRFMITVLRINYGVTADKLRCELHLRMDQKEQTSRIYWAEQLGIPIENFGYTAFDKRSIGKPTYEHYKGVCVVACRQVAIQRKLIYLYNLFCDKVEALNVQTLEMDA